MVARYAPSVVNLLMDCWEEEYVYNQNIPQIILYRRYIDDLIILWDGTAETFQEFLRNLNINRYGLTFTGKWDTERIDYLDLEIYKSGPFLHTKTFFKVTDRNGYIPSSSCHHPRWKANVPKGQLLRLRRNCNSIEDFKTQADVIVNRFKEKGYTGGGLAKLKEEVLNMDRDSLLVHKNKINNRKHGVAFITGFNSQFKEEHI